MRKFFFLFAFIVLASFVAGDDAAKAVSKPFPDPARFPLPQGYEPNVEFWTRVYGEFKDNQVAIHDTSHINIVLLVIDLPDKNGLLASAETPNIAQKLQQLKTILMDLDKDPNSVSKSDEHKRIFELYKGIYDPGKFKMAAQNLRLQYGIKDRFEKGLGLMTLYIDRLKLVFAGEGLPEELAYLPLVESSFNNASLSKTRAAGIFQFMPSAARIFGLTVNDSIDERLDPFAASRAAARYLKRSYSLFGNWPLAIMSYNHGQQGVANAVRSVGSSDFMTILTNYKGRVFGFASQNFYAEFLAACKVMNDANKYFGDVAYSSPLKFDSVRLNTSIPVATLLAKASITREDLRMYNPSLTSLVIFGRRSIPAGYELRLPEGKIKDVPAFIASLQPTRPATTQQASAAPATKVASAPSASKAATSSHHVYTVRRGDTLYSISRRFATTVDAIRRINGLNHNNIIPGQKLTISAR